MVGHVVSQMRLEGLRLSTRKANPEISPSVGMQPPSGFPRSKDGRCPRLPLN